MKKHFQLTLIVLFALAFSTSSYAQLNSVYGTNSATPGFQNVLVGYKAGNSLNSSAKYNTFTGTFSGVSVSSSAYNTYYGYNSGAKHRGEYNTFIGTEASSGSGLTSSASTSLGYAAGADTEGGGNLFLGVKAGSGLGSVNDQLYINNSGGTPLIYGNFADDQVGINTTAPLSTLDVRGSNVIVTDPGTTAANFINSRAAAMGQSGGPGGTTPCDIYGFRAQTNINNSINVGMAANVPTILWDSSSDDLTFAYRNPFGSATCSTRLMQMGQNVGGSIYQLVFNGQGRVNGGWTVISDKRLKRNIQTIGNAMALVEQLNGVTYTYDNASNPDMQLPEGKVYGFIAQEVQAVIPEVTTTSEEDGLVGIKYTEIIPLLTEGMKEQQAVIESQEEVIAEQQDQLNVMEERLAALEQMMVASKNSEASSAAKLFNGVKLSQNRPNPFSDVTTIEYEISNDAVNATLDVFDMEGKMLKSFNIQSGAGTIELDARTLQSGTYVYAINVDGANVATNIMIVQK